MHFKYFTWKIKIINFKNSEFCCVRPSILKRWKGQKYFYGRFHSSLDTYQPLNPDPWSAITLHWTLYRVSYGKVIFSGWLCLLFISKGHKLGDLGRFAGPTWNWKLKILAYVWFMIFWSLAKSLYCFFFLCLIYDFLKPLKICWVCFRVI